MRRIGRSRAGIFALAGFFVPSLRRGAFIITCYFPCTEVFEPIILTHAYPVFQHFPFRARGTLRFRLAAFAPRTGAPFSRRSVTRYTTSLCAAIVTRLALFRFRARAFTLIGYGASTPFSPCTVGSVHVRVCVPFP